MKKTSLWLQKQSSGSFFPVLIAGACQGQFSKVQPHNYVARLMGNLIGTTCSLCVVVALCYFMLCPTPLSPEKLKRLIETQQTGIKYSQLPTMFVGLALLLSCGQYIFIRSETQLSWWYFALSSLIAVLFGFFARFVLSYFLNRRIQAVQQLATNPSHPS